MNMRTASVVGFMLVTIGGCHVARLKTIEPVVVATHSAQQTHDIVKSALALQRWIVVNEEPGVIHAAMSGGAWSVAIDLVYDAESVTIRYASSSKLKYHKSRRGRESIHKNYNVWIKRLANEIKTRGRRVK